MANTERKFQPPPVGDTTLSAIQLIQRRFEQHIVGEENRFPSTRVDRFMEEAIELGQMKEGHSRESFDLMCNTCEPFRKAVAMEAVDALIVAIGVIDSLGYNAQNLFNEKMNLSYQKYSLSRMAELRYEGHSYEESQRILKEEWDYLHPKDEFGNPKFDE